MARMLWNFDIVLCEQSRDWMQQDVVTLWVKPPLFVKLSARKRDR